MDIRLNPDSGTPVYLQLVEAVLGGIASGEWKPGDKLPTVRAMSQATGLAAGTVRHAYDQLAREGAVDMAQGRGTFVRAQEPGAGSRQKQAMAAIEAMLEKLEELEFTPREVSMYLSLALRRRGAARKSIPVAVVDCNPESVRQVALQLSRFPGVELSEFLLDDVRSAAGILDDYPLVVTTQTHAPELQAILGERQEALGKVVLSPSAGTIMELSRVEAGPGILIYCETPRYAQIVKNGLRLFPDLRALDAPVCVSGEANLAPLLESARAVITAPDYLGFAPPEDTQALAAFEKRGGRVIQYHHQIDLGSLMYIEERIKALSER